MVKYIKRIDAKVHAIKGGLVESFAEFDKKYPEKEYVFILDKHNVPMIKKRIK